MWYSPRNVSIDEWDAICRESEHNEKAMEEYVKLLRRMFKSADAMSVFAGVYMTGILPVKKYKTESALNSFWEYTMIQPMKFAKYFGFTKDEVKTLCENHNMDFEEMAKWYDGYGIGKEPSMFNPSSVLKQLKCYEGILLFDIIIVILRYQNDIIKLKGYGEQGF